jgi:hypothetical protein
LSGTWNLDLDIEVFDIKWDGTVKTDLLSGTKVRDLFAIKHYGP